MRKLSTTIVRLLIITFILTIVIVAQQPAVKTLDPKIYEPYLGTYKTKSGELIVIGRNIRRLYYKEPRTGRARALKPQSETSLAETVWSAGPSLVVYTPTAFQIIFTRNKNGEVSALTRKVPGRPDEIAKKASLYREEEVVFRNGDVTLGGKLLIPSTTGPHPAAILLHGSGPQDRNGERSEIRWVADHFARHGIAALIYDKRGFAASGGNVATAGFSDFAKDALAGLTLLQSRQDINPKQIGLWGISQAGWVMLTATTMSKDIAFIISVSAGGSGFTPARQNNYNIATEMRVAGFSEGDINQVMTSYDLFYDVVRAGGRGDGTKLDAEIHRALQKNSKLKDWLPPLSTEIDWKKRDQWFLALDIDLNPEPLWQRYDGPVLGIFGELDSSTPVSLVVPIMARTLASRRNTDYAIRVFPKANHNIMEAVTGSDSELPRLDKFDPEFLNTMTDWLRSRLDMKN